MWFEGLELQSEASWSCDCPVLESGRDGALQSDMAPPGWVGRPSPARGVGRLTTTKPRNLWGFVVQTKTDFICRFTEADPSYPTMLAWHRDPSARRPARMLCRSGPSGHLGISSPCHPAHGHSSAADTSVHMNPGINPTDPARNAGHLDQARGTDRQVGSADGKPEVRGTNLYPLSVSPRTSQ